MNRAFSAHVLNLQILGLCPKLSMNDAPLALILLHSIFCGVLARLISRRMRKNNDRGGNGQEERTNKCGPEGRPNDPRKYVPVHVIAKTKLAKMHALSHRTLKAPAPEMVFGDIDCRHYPDQNIVKRYRNRGSDLVAAENPRYSDRQQCLQRIQRGEPEKIPIADPRAIECGVSTIVINVM